MMFIDDYGLSFRVWETVHGIDLPLAGEDRTFLETVSLEEFQNFLRTIHSHDKTNTVGVRYNFIIRLHGKSKILTGNISTMDHSNTGIHLSCKITDQAVGLIAPKTDFKYSGYDIDLGMRMLMYALQLTVALRKAVYTIPLPPLEKSDDGS